MTGSRRAISVVVATATLAGSGRAGAQQPDWAYAMLSAPASVARDDGTRFRLPGTDRTFTRNQIRGFIDDAGTKRRPPADWYPGDHPPMPDIVASGDEGRGIRACSLCHYPNGRGRPGSAGLAGQPKDYLIQQLLDFRSGLRKSPGSRGPDYAVMAATAKGMTPAEIESAAAYFSSIAWTPWIRVVETDTVPKTRAGDGLYVRLEGAVAGTEPIGNRIIELAEDAHRAEVLRDPRSGFIAYVPTGAVKRGEELVRTGAGKTVPCATCHGPDLDGVGPIPALAGRSPSYLARQLWDIKQGVRDGGMTASMKPIVVKLTADDLLNIVAYTASRSVAAAPPTSAAQRP